MKLNINYFKLEFDAIAIFFLSIFIFTFIVNNVPTDINEHINHAVKINSTATLYPANFLFYFIVNLFSGFSNYAPLMYAVTVFILSLANMLKYIISKKIIFALNKPLILTVKKNYLIPIGLFFCFAIPDPLTLFFIKHLYLGKIVPVVWHNSTTILLFPFAILLFWKQFRIINQLDVANRTNMLIINMLVILNVIIKPSFIFVYLPVTFLFLFFQKKQETFKRKLLKLSPILTGFFVVIVQYYLLFKLQSGSIQKEASGVVISKPFEVLSSWIPVWYIPISLFFSFALPLVTCILHKNILKYRPFLYSLSLAILAITISAFVKESGPRMLHGNFTWQNVICAYLLFLTTVSYLIPKFLNNKTKSIKNKILLSLFVIHSLSGVLYIFKIIFTLNYY